MFVKHLCPPSLSRLDLWPWHLIYWPEYWWDRLLIKDYINTYQVLTFWGRAFLTYLFHTVRETNFTSDLWVSIGIINSSKTIYLPSLICLGQIVLELSIAKGVGDQHDHSHWPLTWISIGIIFYSSRTIYLQSLNLLGQSVLQLSVAQGEVNWHDIWPSDLNISRDHLPVLIKYYLPTKFEPSRTKSSWIIYCTRWRDWHDLWP